MHMHLKLCQEECVPQVLLMISFDNEKEDESMALITIHNKRMPENTSC